MHIVMFEWNDRWGLFWNLKDPYVKVVLLYHIYLYKYNLIHLIYVTSIDMQIVDISNQCHINTQSARARPNSHIYTKAHEF
jgi:hypothetical protein